MAGRRSLFERRLRGRIRESRNRLSAVRRNFPWALCFYLALRRRSYAEKAHEALGRIRLELFVLPHLHHALYTKIAVSYRERLARMPSHRQSSNSGWLVRWYMHAMPSDFVCATLLPRPYLHGE